MTMAWSSGCAAHCAAVREAEQAEKVTTRVSALVGAQAVLHQTFI
ncbi:MAG: hypothetical protein ABSA31_09560 [Acidimicrobiales bacterium]